MSNLYVIQNSKGEYSTSLPHMQSWENSLLPSAIYTKKSADNILKSYHLKYSSARIVKVKIVEVDGSTDIATNALKSKKDFDSKEAALELFESLEDPAHIGLLREVLKEEKNHLFADAISALILILEKKIAEVEE